MQILALILFVSLSVYLLCCQCCLLFKHTQVLLHVLQSGSPVQRDSWVRVQQHTVLVHRRHIGRMIGGEDELQAAQTEHQPVQHARHDEEKHWLMWVSLHKSESKSSCQWLQSLQNLSWFQEVSLSWLNKHEVS